MRESGPGRSGWRTRENGVERTKARDTMSEGNKSMCRAACVREISKHRPELLPKIARNLISFACLGSPGA